MNDSPDDKLTFEQALAELKRIVHDLEDGAIGLEESLSALRKGRRPVEALLRTALRQAERRIQLLTGLDDEERPIAHPFEHTASVEAEKPKKRKKIGEQPEELF